MVESQHVGVHISPSGTRVGQSPHPVKQFQVNSTKIIRKDTGPGERTGSVTHDVGKIVYPRAKGSSWTLAIHQLQKLTHSGKTKI